jgi:hypothetical protein
MTCIVSAYYKIPSKRPHEKYVPDLIRWFRSVGTAENVHFFTTEDVRDELKSIVNTGSVVFHILPFEQLTAVTKLGREFWERQYARDPERYHSPELGMIWYEKRHFVRRVMEIDPSTLFIWCDAGCVRDDVSERAGSRMGTRGVMLDDDKLHMQQLYPLLSKDFYRYPDRSSAGAIMAGNRSSWLKFIDHYEESLLEYDLAGVPAIMEQYVYARCAQKQSDSYRLHSVRTAVDSWFQFLEIL